MPDKTPKKFNFEKLGAKLGGLLVGVIGAAREHGSKLTVQEVLELGSRPLRHACLFCGEPQDPPGAMLGVNCKERLRKAGMSTALHASDYIKDLTMADLVEIANAAKEAGFFGTTEVAEQPPLRTKKIPTDRPKTR